MEIKLRRGFKTEAEEYAVDFRQELRVGAAAPLDMFRLANHLEIPAHPVSNIRGELAIATYQLLTRSVKSPFSAVTVYFGHRREIIFNDSHAPTRQQSDLGHELSHAILGHPPSALTKESGGRHYDKELEDEANCLSGILLVPRAAAISIVASGESITDAAMRFNISPAMMRMRLNTSGATKIMARSRRP